MSELSKLKKQQEALARKIEKLEKEKADKKTAPHLRKYKKATALFQQAHPGIEHICFVHFRLANKWVHGDRYMLRLKDARGLYQRSRSGACQALSLSTREISEPLPAHTWCEVLTGQLSRAQAESGLPVAALAHLFTAAQEQRKNYPNELVVFVNKLHICPVCGQATPTDAESVFWEHEFEVFNMGARMMLGEGSILSNAAALLSATSEGVFYKDPGALSRSSCPDKCRPVRSLRAQWLRRAKACEDLESYSRRRADREGIRRLRDALLRLYPGLMPPIKRSVEKSIKRQLRKRIAARPLTSAEKRFFQLHVGAQHLLHGNINHSAAA